MAKSDMTINVDINVRNLPADFERRFLPVSESPGIRIEQRSVDGKQVDVMVGYGAVFGKLSENLGGFRERISPNAFDKFLAKVPDVRGLYNHDPAFVLGRTSAKTMRLSTDATGLKYEIDLPDRQDVRDLQVSIKRGDINGSSFSFRIAKDGDEWEEDDETGVQLRTLNEISFVLDVGPVTFPAYPDTTAALRSLEQKRAVSTPLLRAAQLRMMTR